MASKPALTLLPVLSLLLSATLWGLLWYPLRLLEQHGMPEIWVTLVAYASVSLLGLFVYRSRLVWFRRRPLMLLLLTLLSGWCNVSFILAVVEGPLVRVILLFYLSPVWAVILGRLFLGERLTGTSALVFLFALVGAMAMLWDPAVGKPWPLSVNDWLAISSGFAFAAANVTVRAMDRVPVAVKTMASWAGAVVVSLVFIFVTGAQWPSAAAGPWFASAILGIVGIAVMTLAVVYGVTHMPVHRSAVLLLFEIVVVAVSGQLLSSEPLITHELVGGVLIVSASLAEAWLQVRKKA
jgi:drug/metabolite transporter (DMT)-like permease